MIERELLSNYLKYCLGYIQLTRERTMFAQQKESVYLTQDNLNLLGLLNGESDGKLDELINLPLFYSYDPKKVPEQAQEAYDYEKQLANRIHDIYSGFENSSFTKQIVLSFGYFEVELPIVEVELTAAELNKYKRIAEGKPNQKEIKKAILERKKNHLGKRIKVQDLDAEIISLAFGNLKIRFDDGAETTIKPADINQANETEEEIIKFLIADAQEKIKRNDELLADRESELEPEKKIFKYPLFTLPVKINTKLTPKGVGEYSLLAVDPEVQVNISMLELILGPDRYFQLIKEISEYENSGKLALPMLSLETFFEIWHNIKAKLRLTEANFDEDSFSLDQVNIALSPRVNYFLAEDLTKLTQLEESNLDNTALVSWTNFENLNVKTDLPQETELYFPFPYDKYQLSTLGLIKNKAAIIQGPPGTGKSETIANIICQLVATGNRVLFVSQKTQALKVVKDKLKKLNLKYLFGFIPNPNSQQIDAEDEIDGIAPQLSALNSYIQALEDVGDKKLEDSLSPIVEKKILLQNSIGKAFESQREYHDLYNELLLLKQYEIPSVDILHFRDNFTSETWQSIQKTEEDILRVKQDLFNHKNQQPAVLKNPLLKALEPVVSQNSSEALEGVHSKLQALWIQISKSQDKIESLLKATAIYEQDDEKKELDKLFLSLEPAKHNLDAFLLDLKLDIENTAFDGHSKVLRSVNNLNRQWRLKNTLHKLPREIKDYVASFLEQDKSRIEAKKFITSIVNYFQYYSNLQEIESTRRDLLLILTNFCSEFKNESTFSDELNSLIEDHVCKLDIEEQEINQLFEALIQYFKYFEIIEVLVSENENLNKKFESDLEILGLSSAGYLLLKNIVETQSQSRVEEIKDNISRFYEIKDQLNILRNTEDANKLTKDLGKLVSERKNRSANYLQNIINERLLNKWNSGVTVKQIVQKVARAFAKSKKAFKTFDKLRKENENFNTILDLIPIWIMELDDASRILPLQAGIFDYVILDEASQCNIAYTLPVMFRSKHVLFVGDSEQMRDNNILFKSNRYFETLAQKYNIPADKQIKVTGGSVQSVLDIAEMHGFMSRSLHNHYRSPKELIGFSNEFFYKPKGKNLVPLNTNYLTYGDSNRVMVIHEVDADGSDEISDRINKAEANKILELFKELRSKSQYNQKSIGILTFFNDQATYLRSLFEENGLKEEQDNYKISIIEGVQGDEKDIIIYSFVIRSIDQKNKYVALTGEKGDIKADINRGRVNVAFSRARQQVHCFTSISPQEFPDGIWIKKYLEYVKEHGEVSSYSTELKPFDSKFEQDFYQLLKEKLNDGYIIRNQVESCGFKIDFVISNLRTGSRIAVECDGPTHFKNEVDEAYGIHTESDEERQRILEVAGWQFFRIKYMDWVDERFKRENLVEQISLLLS